LESVPGLGHYSAVAIAARIGDIERFRRPDSLANYFGLTPGCRNSGEATQRLGSITKRGSKLVRHLLNQAVIKVLRFDAAMRAWFKRIKKRRGAKISRVAVMWRLATILCPPRQARQG
jgi:transposase